MVDLYRNVIFLKSLDDPIPYIFSGRIERVGRMDDKYIINIFRAVCAMATAYAEDGCYKNNRSDDKGYNVFFFHFRVNGDIKRGMSARNFDEK